MEGRGWEGGGGGWRDGWVRGRAAAVGGCRVVRPEGAPGGATLSTHRRLCWSNRPQPHHPHLHGRLAYAQLHRRTPHEQLRHRGLHHRQLQRLCGVGRRWRTGQGGEEAAGRRQERESVSEGRVAGGRRGAAEWGEQSASLLQLAPWPPPRTSLEHGSYAPFQTPASERLPPRAAAAAHACAGRPAGRGGRQGGWMEGRFGRGERPGTRQRRRHSDRQRAQLHSSHCPSQLTNQPTD